MFLGQKWITQVNCVLTHGLHRTFWNWQEKWIWCTNDIWNWVEIVMSLIIMRHCEHLNTLRKSYEAILFYSFWLMNWSLPCRSDLFNLSMDVNVDNMADVLCRLHAIHTYITDTNKLAIECHKTTRKVIFCRKSTHLQQRG